MNYLRVVSFIIIVMAFKICHCQQQEIIEPESTLDEVDRKYIVTIAAKARDCYFIENLREKQKLNLHFMVTNSNDNGQQLDIMASVQAPTGRSVYKTSRVNEDEFIAYEIKSEEDGDYEICFNNRFSFFQEKRVFWEYDLEGDFNFEKVFQEVVKENHEKFLNITDGVMEQFRNISRKIGRSRHKQWWSSNTIKRDTIRMENLQKMIDRWSMIHILVVLIVGICQVLILRRFFNAKATPHKLNARI